MAQSTEVYERRFSDEDRREYQHLKYACRTMLRESIIRRMKGQTSMSFMLLNWAGSARRRAAVLASSSPMCVSLFDWGGIG